MSIRESMILELDGLMPGVWRSERERVVDGLLTRLVVDGYGIGPGPLRPPEHISTDGLTALCGASLIDPDPPVQPVCPGCAAVDALPFLRRWLRRFPFRTVHPS